MLNLVANGPSGYTIYNSLRTRASASAYLNRTTGTPTLTTKFTWSGWIKRGQLSTTQVFYSIGQPTTSANYIQCQINTSDQIVIQGTTTSASVLNVATVAVLRDSSAWYHVVVSIDTTQATAANRVIVYINGVQQTLTITTQIAQNATIPGNTSGYISAISTLNFSGAYQSFFDGYLAEVNFIDGQALTPSSFGITNSFTGVWQPAKYSGTYGTNGFYQKYSSIATTSGSNTGLGQDFSGNGNYYNTTNISVTAGVTYDAMTDVPTLTNPTVANYATLNPLDRKATQNTFSEGNLRVTTGTTEQGPVFTTMMLPQGKWYAEFYITNAANAEPLLGVANMENSSENCYVSNFFPTTGRISVNNSIVQTGFTGPVTGNTVSVLADIIAGSYIFWINGTQVGTAQSATINNPSFVMFDGRTSFGTTYQVNFGQRPFTYTPPTGYKALNTFNLPDSTIVKGNTVMDATLYTGNLTGQSITNAAAFKPDLVWIKSRSAATDNKLTDFVRGATKALISNTTGAETTDLTGLTAFNTNGFTVGASTVYNNTGATYVGWQWAGTGATVSNTSGSITSTVDANTTAGFSIVTYTGTGSAATVGHGLGVAPRMIIAKTRSAANDWPVYHASIGAANALRLDLTLASAAGTQWNSTTPTSTVFSIGTATETNQNGTTYVAYCWSEIAGFSKFGSYTGNGSTDGTFVYTGFLPKFILVKRTDATSNWLIYDTSRNTYNVASNYLLPDSSGAEGSAVNFDLLSNGFKCKSATGVNVSSGTYIYMAFAENPFKNANAR